MTDQSDRELLEAAARAAGIEYEWRLGYGNQLRLTAPDATAIFWRPLMEDHHCARLEAALLIDVNWSDDAVESQGPIGESVIEEFADHGGDRNAARRYASVRAAAALAKEMG